MRVGERPILHQLDASAQRASHIFQLATNRISALNLPHIKHDKHLKSTLTPATIS